MPKPFVRVSHNAAVSRNVNPNLNWIDITRGYQQIPPALRVNKCNWFHLFRLFCLDLCIST